MYFLNCKEIKQLFSDILKNIEYLCPNNKYNLGQAYDQDFIIYHCVINEMYDIQKLNKYCKNNHQHTSKEHNNSLVFNHFCIPCGKPTNKLEKMTNFMNDIMFNIKNKGVITDKSLINKKYIWENANIEFLEDGKMNAFGAGKYSFIDKYLVKCDFGGREHLLKF